MVVTHEDSNHGEDVLEDVQEFWDADAATYDNSVSHRPRDLLVRATWLAAVERLLPPPPARVLDVGAGTGFLSLMAARLGHSVTALDLSPMMLERLRSAASAAALEIETLVGPADHPSSGFDAVMERHLLWTLPSPLEALRSWRAAAPNGRLVLFESLWGEVDSFELLRARVRKAIKNLRHEAPDHHSTYSEALRSSMPLGTGTPPSRLIELVEEAGWRRPRVVRLRDVEWAERSSLPPIERLVGVTPRFCVLAD